MNVSHQDEMVVDEFYDLITEAERPVMHAAIRVRNQDQAKLWEWQLAGTYIIANCERTVAIACDGLRLARFTAPPASGILDSQMCGFLPHHYNSSCENDTFYDLFDQILAAWSIVKNCAIYERSYLTSLCTSDQLNGITATILGLTLNAKHILDFCYAAGEDFITCQVVTNQSAKAAVRLKLIAGQLEELFIPII